MKRVSRRGLNKLRFPLQSKVQSCEHCRDLFSSAGSLQASSPGRHKTSSEPLDEEKDELNGQLRQLELELAQTKLQLVEAKCRIQVSCAPERRSGGAAFLFFNSHPDPNARMK